MVKSFSEIQLEKDVPTPYIFSDVARYSTVQMWPGTVQYRRGQVQYSTDVASYLLFWELVQPVTEVHRNEMHLHACLCSVGSSGGFLGSPAAATYQGMAAALREVGAFWTRHVTHYTLHNTHYTLKTTHDTLPTTHYTQHLTHYTLHTTHYTLKSTN